MKKVILTMAVVFGLATAASAQLVVGGNIGFDGNVGNKYKDTDRGLYHKDGSSFAMSIAPKVGYMLLDQKLEVGAALQFKYSHNKDYVVMGSIEESAPGVIKTDPVLGIPMWGEDGKAQLDSKTASFSWTINPYARYRLFLVKGFAMWVECEAYLGTSFSSKKTYYAIDKGYLYENWTDAMALMTHTQATQYERKQDDVDKYMDAQPKENYFNGGIALRPVLTYDINEHWRLETQLNLLSVYLSGYVKTTTQEQTYVNGVTGETEKRDFKTTENECSLGLVLQDKIKGNAITGATLFDGVGFLTIGVAYKF